MRIYNTLSGKKESVSKRGRKNFFVCGPTVYDHSHIGHARTYLAFDIIVRYLRSRGWQIFYLQNITDIDDKIIARAKEEEKTWKEIADFYTKEYLKDVKSLEIISVDKYAPATKFIPQIVNQIQTLIKKGYAYEIKGDGIYFDISKSPDYGKLSGRTVEQAEDAVSRIDKGLKKRNRGDFCLWKLATTQMDTDPLRQSCSAAKGEPRPSGREASVNIDKHRSGSPVIVDGTPAWPSPLGWGRPGWHIEDTAISEKYFGPQYDWHGGAEDLKFPHHEAEIAQQESASGKKPFVKIWIHTGFLLVDNQKMSKKLKNFITIKDFLKNESPETLRWFVLGHHYRSKINYNKKSLAQTKKSFATVKDFLDKLDFIARTLQQGKENKKTSFGITNKIKNAEEEFHKAMEDDLNTPEAIAAIFSFMSKLQDRTWEIPKKDAKAAKKFIETALGSFGFTLKNPSIPAKIKALAQEREKSRVNEQFIKADALRKEIKELGYEVEDTPLGPLVRLSQEHENVKT